MLGPQQAEAAESRHPCALQCSIPLATRAYYAWPTFHCRHWDVVFDAAAAYTFAAVRPVLRRNGCMVAVRPSPGAMLGGLLARVVSGTRYSFLITGANGHDLALLARLWEQDTLRPLIDSSFPLDMIADAHRCFEAGNIKGKIRIQIGQPQD